MAGTFTHWMTVEKAISELPQGSEVLALMPKFKPYVLLGAVSPDLPYLTDIMLNTTSKLHHCWADRMHYENTGAFVRHGMENLLPMRSGKDARKICTAWLLGYASHVVADTVAHPVINGIVGPYRFNSDEHRQCEMTQDSIMFRKVLGGDITQTKYHHFLEKTSNRPNPGSYINSRHVKFAIGAFWEKTLMANYPQASGHYDDINPDKWFANYLETIGFAAKPSPVTRYFGERLHVVYQAVGDIKKADKDKYFNKVNLPDGARGSFMVAFDKAVDDVCDVWGRMMRDIKAQTPENCSEYLKSWDLDLGVDMDNASLW